MSGTSGSSGFGSVSIEQIDKRTGDATDQYREIRQGGNAMRTFRDCQRRTPLILQDV